MNENEKDFIPEENLPDPDDSKLPSDLPFSEINNDKILESKILGGSTLEKIPVGNSLHVTTKSGTKYIIEKREDGYYASGHPEFCPEPTKAVIHGSAFSNTSMIKPGFIGRGLRLEMEVNGKKIKTSEIQEVTEVPGNEEKTGQ